jgi:hypothetical protein
MFDLGIRLQLLIGPTVPLPAPGPVMDALSDVEVRNNDRERDVFQLTFTLGKKPLVDYTLLQSGLVATSNRVVITVIIGVLPQILIDGIITRHEVNSSNEPGESKLVVTGEDISLKLDLEEKRVTHPNQPDSLIVTKLVSSYGLVPMVTPTTDVPIELQRIPTQQSTDLRYIQRLAERNGFVFYITPGPLPGANVAYWGPDNRLGVPQPALTQNMGAYTNVETLDFGFDALGPSAPQVTILEPLTRSQIPIPIPSGILPSLAGTQATPLRHTLPQGTAHLDLAQAALRARAAVVSSADAVTATGELDVVRYGRALRSRALVGVRGAGFQYSGIYYVKQVKHNIQRGQYRQHFTLSRGGLGASSPVVVP